MDKRKNYRSSKLLPYDYFVLLCKFTYNNSFTQTRIVSTTFNYPINIVSATVATSNITITFSTVINFLNEPWEFEATYVNQGNVVNTGINCNTQILPDTNKLKITITRPVSFNVFGVSGDHRIMLVGRRYKASSQYNADLALAASSPTTIIGGTWTNIVY